MIVFHQPNCSSKKAIPFIRRLPYYATIWGEVVWRGYNLGRIDTIDRMDGTGRDMMDPLGWGLKSKSVDLQKCVYRIDIQMIIYICIYIILYIHLCEWLALSYMHAPLCQKKHSKPRWSEHHSPISKIMPTPASTHLSAGALVRSCAANTK